MICFVIPRGGIFLKIDLAATVLKDFVRDIREIRIEPDKELQSYDVSALFTSVPVGKPLKVIRERLEEDQNLSDRTPLAPDNIIRLLSLCLKCTYFLFK